MAQQEFAPGLFIQGIASPLTLHDFKLIAFDMDSTLINIECIDEIADAAGRKAEVSTITEAAMRVKSRISKTVCANAWHCSKACPKKL